METQKHIEPTIIVILGATGDLTYRKLIPAIYNLWLDNWLPKEFAVIGVSRGKYTDATFKNICWKASINFPAGGK